MLNGRIGDKVGEKAGDKADVTEPGASVPTFTVVVPARYGSTRLPGKPLLEIAGEPMVAHVWRRACQSHASRVVVATDDSRSGGHAFTGE